MAADPKISTALKNYVAGTGSAKAALAAGLLYIYTGTVPVDADAALTDQTLLCVIGSENPPTDDSPATGLDLGTASDGAIAKDGDTWIGRVQGGVTDVAGTFYRWCGAGVSPSAADNGTDTYRIQDTVGASNAGLIINPNNFTDNDSNTKSIGVAEIRF